MYRVNKKLCQEKNAREKIVNDDGHAILIEKFLGTPKNLTAFFSAAKEYACARGHEEEIVSRS